MKFYLSIHFGRFLPVSGVADNTDNKNNGGFTPFF